MLMLAAHKISDLQNFRSMLVSNIEAGISDASAIIALIDQRLGSFQVSVPRPATTHRSDNLTTCTICGKPAIVVPLSIADRTQTATHAIQCQNRPAKDQPWRDGMCGHTEYIMRGDR